MGETANQTTIAIHELHRTMAAILDLLREIRDRMAQPQQVSGDPRPLVLRGMLPEFGIDFASSPSRQRTMTIVDMNEPLPPELERAMIGIAELWRRSQKIERLRLAVRDLEAEIERLLRESEEPGDLMPDPLNAAVWDPNEES